MAARALSSCSADSSDGQRGLGRDHGLPGRDRVEAAEYLAAPGRTAARPAPGRTAARPAAGPARSRPATPTDAVRHLHELRQLGDPGRDRDRAALQVARPAAPVPLLVGGADPLAHRRRAARAARPASGPACACWEIIPSSWRCPEKANSSPTRNRCSGGLPGADQPHGRQRAAHAAQLVDVLAGLERDVVAEPFRLLVRVSVTADVDQQGGVVDRHPVLLGQPRAVGQPQRDQALPQHVLHRLAEPQVDAERQRRDQLGQPDRRRQRHPLPPAQA